MNKKGLKFYLKVFLFEIIALAVFVLILIQFLNIGFARSLITGFTYFRPEYTFTLFVIFFLLTAVLALLLLMQIRKKKLKSTKRLSPFAKTVDRSHKIRALSQTQTVYTSETGISGVKSVMPKDVDGTNPNLIEFYFDYDEKLNI